MHDGAVHCAGKGGSWGVCQPAAGDHSDLAHFWIFGWVIIIIDVYVMQARETAGASASLPQGTAVDMDFASILATFPADLREEAFLGLIGNEEVWHIYSYLVMCGSMGCVASGLGPRVRGAGSCVSKAQRPCRSHHATRPSIDVRSIVQHVSSARAVQCLAAGCTA